MSIKKTGFLVAFVGFGLAFTSGLSVFLTESQNQEDLFIDNMLDDTPNKIPDSNDGAKKKDKKVISASITINPHILNLKSKGKWITVFIELPLDYRVEDIYIQTVILNNEILAEEEPTSISDFDNDDLLDLMLKFDRSSVISLLGSQELCEVSVSGKLNNGNKFNGSCEIVYL